MPINSNCERKIKQLSKNGGSGAKKPTTSEASNEENVADSTSSDGAGTNNQEYGASGEKPSHRLGPNHQRTSMNRKNFNSLLPQPAKM